MAHPCDTGMCNNSGCADCLPGVTPKQILLDIYLHNTDLTGVTNNTFINRYLQNRVLRVPCGDIPFIPRVEKKE